MVSDERSACSPRNKVLRWGVVRGTIHHMTAAHSESKNRRPVDSLPNRLALIRAENGRGSAALSINQAAEIAGLTPRVWGYMEKGKGSHDLLDNLQKIADAFGYDLMWLTYGGALASQEQTLPRFAEIGAAGNASVGSVTVEKFSPTQKLLGKRKPRSTPVSVKLSTRCNDSSTAA